MYDKKLSQNPSKRKEMPQFTQGKKNTFIVFTVYFGDYLSKKENNSGGKFSQVQLSEIKCEWLSFEQFE